MEGDGPIMGTPKPAGVIVMGRDLPAVDATAARIMGIDPLKVAYLRAAHGGPATIAAENILQRGESIAAVRTDFELLDFIPAHQGLRLSAQRKRIKGKEQELWHASAGTKKAQLSPDRLSASVRPVAWLGWHNPLAPGDAKG